MSLNTVSIMGRFVKDPELKYTQTGVPVCGFTLAVERHYKEKNGNRAADFVDVVAWRGAAEFVSKHFTKGRAAIVSGRLQSRDWEDKSGSKRRAWEVIASDIYFADSKKPEVSDDMPEDHGFEEIPDEEGLPF